MLAGLPSTPRTCNWQGASEASAPERAAAEDSAASLSPHYQCSSYLCRCFSALPPWPLFRPLPLFQRATDIEDWPFVFRDLYSPLCAKTIHKAEKKSLSNTVDGERLLVLSYNLAAAFVVCQWQTDAQTAQLVSDTYET